MSRIFKVDENPIISEDGNASLTLIGADTSRDGGGYIYRFEILKPSYVEGPLAGNVLIGEVTSVKADNYYSNKIENYSNLKLTEQYRLYKIYSSEFGRIFIVKSFYNTNFDIINTKHEQISEVSSIICRIYIRRYSSYELNNSDQNADCRGFYADKITFSPNELPPSFRKVVTAGEVFGA